jgi:surface carbohydrate biosynthesis protein
MKQTIILPIEIKKREFDSRLLLAYHLCKAGYTVIIGDRSGCARESKYLHNCVYIAKSLAHNQKELFLNYKRNGGKILVLYEEGGYVGRQNNVKNEIFSSYPQEMLPYVDQILVYGESFKRTLVNHLKESGFKNVSVCGNGRFDLHKKKYKPYYKEEIDSLNDAHGQYILFNGNFVAGNHYLGQDYFRDEIQNNLEMTDDMKQQFFQRMTEVRNNLIAFIELIKDIASVFTSKTIIVRPHPGEKLELYTSSLQSSPNVIITNEGMAAAWIIGSEVLIHQDCTTAIEAIFAEKPVISYIPFEDRSQLFDLSINISSIATNPSEVIEKLDAFLAGQQYDLDMETNLMLNNEIVNRTKETPDILVDLVNKLTIDLVNNPQPRYFSVFKFIKKIFRRYDNYFRWIVRKVLNRQTGYSIKIGHSTRNEVKSKLKKLSSIEGSQMDFKIRSLGVNTFEVSL